jgi:hypothetical protein
MTCSCTGAFIVGCRGGPEAGRPPIDGCSYMGIDAGIAPNVTDWCCPPTCFRDKAQDSNCGAYYSYMCPRFKDGGLAMPLPSAQCVPGMLSDSYCCP